MSFTYYTQELKEARRDALVNQYLAVHDFSSLPEGSSVTTADDLYEYLLLDTKISDSVTTSPLSEAVNSLQLCIHRAIEGYEGVLEDDATQYLAKGAFLDNWDRYNKRYGTWAGKEKLRFYSGNYIEPSLRMEKTELFKEFENKISQSKLTEANSVLALKKYITDFTSLEGLHYLSAVYNAEKNEVYFIALMSGVSERYFWRTLKLKQNSEKKYSPLEWGEWIELNVVMKNVYTENGEKKIGLSFRDGRLKVNWMAEEKTQVDESNISLNYFHYSVTFTLNEWGEIHKEPCLKTDVIFDTWGSIDCNYFSLPSGMHSDSIALFSTVALWHGELLAVSQESENKIFTLFKYNNEFYIRIFSLMVNQEGKLTPKHALFTGKLNTADLENIGHSEVSFFIDIQNGNVPILLYGKSDDYASAYDVSDVNHPKKIKYQSELITLSYLMDGGTELKEILKQEVSGRKRQAIIERYSRDTIKKIQSGVSLTSFTYPNKGVFPAVILNADFDGGPVNPESNFTDDVTFEVSNNSDGTYNIDFVFSEKFKYCYCAGADDWDSPEFFSADLRYAENHSGEEMGDVRDLPVLIDRNSRSGRLSNLTGNGDKSIQDLMIYKYATDIPSGVDNPDSMKVFGLLCWINFNAPPRMSDFHKGTITDNKFTPLFGSKLSEFYRENKSNGNYTRSTLPGLYDESPAVYNKNLTFLSSLTGDIYGAEGLYLWEIFFHIPFLVATRFAAEQRFDEAELWYKYIFDSAGYRNEDGKLLTDDSGSPRYWNGYPLQQDTAWDALVDMHTSTDPDIIATADPMHYKLAIFLHTLDLLITRGDAAYRQLDRDSLTEAKMYYMQALQLLGPRPDIRITNSWDDPTLAKEAEAIMPPATRGAISQTFAQWLRAGDSNEMGDGDFLPPYNDALLVYWDKVEVRLFNLRHNLSLTGQPLDLPLFSTPVDPAELHRQQSGGDGVQGETSLANTTDVGWRYPLLAEHARNAASQLTQFGGSLLNALERRDSEQLTLLLQTQHIAVLNQQQDIAQKNLDSLGASLVSLNSSLASAQIRKKHYTHLIEGNLSVQEQAGLNLRTSSRGLTLVSQALMSTAGALSALPNTFGFANGGGDFGAPMRAAGIVTQAAATANEQSAVINDISAGYQRRTEEWALQRDLADKDVDQMNAQIDSLKAQVAMQQKQRLLTETESANAQAVYDVQSRRFTGQALYNWMVGRLSALYYQLYDTTVPVCLQARNALSREFGSDNVDGLFGGVVWNDLYQGLLAGEGLTTELQKLNNVWLQQGALGLEATRTVSLADLRGEESGSLGVSISDVFAGHSDSADNGVLTLKDGIFSAALDMSKLGLESSYNDKTRRRFIKSISVTLPTLLGPYQDIEATLSCGGQMATLSHGMQDMGRFVANFDDSRFLPFEGTELKAGNQNTVTLSMFNVKGADEAAPNQRSIVENLSDIIFHIHYILR